MEEFRDIKGYEGLYQVSNLGRVKSLSRVIRRTENATRTLRERILKSGISTPGYPYVILQNGKRTIRNIHRLVYEAFVGDLIEGMDIDHIDGNKQNNKASNLQQITRRENLTKDNVKRSRTSKHPGVSWNKSRGKWMAQIYISGKRIALGSFNSERQASDVYQAKCLSLQKA